MFLIPTSKAQHLTRNLQTNKNLTVLFSDLNRDGKRYFPDGEIYEKISKAKSLKNKRVVVLHAGCPKPNEGLIELELILQILEESKARPIEVFFSYFPYARQDSVFEQGETNAAEGLVRKLAMYYRARKIFIIDAHFAGRQWAKKYPIMLLSAVPLLKEQAKKEFGDDLVFLSPDKGGKRRTRIAGPEKKRGGSYEVEMGDFNQFQNVIKNRVVAVVDDILGTGGTLDRFYDECKRAGAKELVALVTHGVLPSGISRIKKKYSKLYLANTVNQSEANVDISNLMYQTIL